MKGLVFFISLIISFSATADTSQFKLELIFAKRGDVAAEFRVATAYEEGIDVKKDLKQAFNWYMKAAKQSHAPSQYKVGEFYEKGIAVAKDEKQALTWYKKAEANGSSRASKRLNKETFEKNEKARKANQLAVRKKLEQEEQERKLAKEKQLASLRAAEIQASQKKKNSDKKQVTKKTIAKEIPRKTVTAINIPNILKVVLNNKWKNQDGAADYLPSTATTCLESGKDELTCFSSEKIRKVNGINIKYTTKSTLVDFKPNGSFKVIYNFNGIDVPVKTGKVVDDYGLLLKQGWQVPALAVHCKATNRKNISCSGKGKKVSFHI